MSIVLGLTGGIASGKSTVTSIFKEFGYPVVDADLIAREVVEPGTKGLASIVSVFGSEILYGNGTLNRKKLAEIIFSDETKRKQLNELLSPYLKQAILSQIASLKEKSPLVIADIPLLYEGGYENFVDQVAVVYVPRHIQLARLMSRDNLSQRQAQARIDSQLSLESKKKMADILFDNQGDIQTTKKNIEKWLAENKLIIK